MSGPFPLSETTTLGALIEAARAVRTRDDLAAALDRIAASAAAASGLGTVIVDLHRAAWDDFEVVAAHAEPPVQRALLGTSSTWTRWAPALAPRFARHGAHHTIGGVLAGADHPGEWSDEDVLLVVLRRTDGDVLGLLRGADPPDGLRPSDEQIEALVLHAQLAALAAQRAGSTRRDADRRLALDGLAAVAGRGTPGRPRNRVLDDVCARVCDALGFQRVAILVGELGGALRAAATGGWRADDPLFVHPVMTITQLSLLLQAAYERHGCHLVERAEAEALLDLDAPLHRSRRNGRGPYAWDDHWLLAGLTGTDGQLVGVLWADDPADRLLPARERLQALRVLADQAASALALAGHAGPPLAHDPLTGLPGRTTLLARLRHALQRVKRSDASIALLFLDLDRFQAVNDSFGHDAGDALLLAIAARIDEGVRPGDTVARFGGDEFAILCEDIDGPDAAMEVAERLREAIAEPVELAAGTAHVTASVGVALPDRSDRGAQELLQAADRAMYEAKASGRDAARLATPGAGWP